MWSEEAGWGGLRVPHLPENEVKFHDKAAKDKGFAKWENEKPRVQAGVDVVDRGTTFEPDQDEADMDETKQDGEVSAGQTTRKSERGKQKGTEMSVIANPQGTLVVLKAEWLGMKIYHFCF